MNAEEFEQTFIRLSEVDAQLMKLTKNYMNDRFKLEKERKQLQAKLQEFEQEH
ncbi:hypothetical protein [uncultured Clostridium sp.]|uniref:hypothetical protein n=1 Tax=Limosilactobacillus reuteri TaxID=1598 RepID=UPI0026729B18|nr:hypothetical protein [uncultured Clostridium sp.]MDD7120708.1 hypothetical protein [Limosilactobacillus reuteri]MDY4730619.1 hypothetical protein [Lactobacillus amylovorus]